MRLVLAVLLAVAVVACSPAPKVGQSVQAIGGESIAVVNSCTLPSLVSVTPTQGIAYGSDPAQWFDQWPATGTPSGRCVLVLTGGGFVSSNPRDCGASHPTVCPMAEMRSGLGDVVLAANYRVSASGGVNPFPAALNDVRSLLFWLAATDPNIPTQTRMVTYCGAGVTSLLTVGFSAGASLGEQAMESLYYPVTYPDGGSPFQTMPNGTRLDGDGTAIQGIVRGAVDYYPYGNSNVAAGLAFYGSTKWCYDFTHPSPNCSSQTLPIYFNSAPSSTPPAPWLDGSPSLVATYTGLPHLMLSGANDVVLLPAQTSGTTLFPVSSGDSYQGLRDAVRAAGDNATEINPSGSGCGGHLTSPAATGCWLAANCTAQAALSSW